jgi:hypothetical protein
MAVLILWVANEVVAAPSPQAPLPRDDEQGALPLLAMIDLSPANRAGGELSFISFEHPVDGQVLVSRLDLFADVHYRQLRGFAHVDLLDSTATEADVTPGRVTLGAGASGRTGRLSWRADGWAGIRLDRDTDAQSASHAELFGYFDRGRTLFNSRLAVAGEAAAGYRRGRLFVQADLSWTKYLVREGPQPDWIVMAGGGGLLATPRLAGIVEVMALQQDPFDEVSARSVAVVAGARWLMPRYTASARLMYQHGFDDMPCSVTPAIGLELSRRW